MSRAAYDIAVIIVIALAALIPAGLVGFWLTVAAAFMADYVRMSDVMRSLIIGAMIGGGVFTVLYRLAFDAWPGLFRMLMGGAADVFAGVGIAEIAANTALGMWAAIWIFVAFVACTAPIWVRFGVKE